MDDIEDIDKLLEAASCPVCFERLPPAISCCVNGHATCETCCKGLKECPTCRQPFSSDKHFCLSQVLAALPAQCDYEHCETVTCSLQQHKIYCGYRLTNCRICQWAGSVNWLFEHCEIDHAGFSLELPVTVKFHSTVHFKEINAGFLHYQFFWVITKGNPITENMTIQFLCEPTKKSMKTVHLLVEFNCRGAEIKTKIKLSFDPIKEDSKENRIVLHYDMLKQFIEEDNLKYMISVEA